jgi:hypothetical protein
MRGECVECFLKIRVFLQIDSDNRVKLFGIEPLDGWRAEEPFSEVDGLIDNPMDKSRVAMSFFFRIRIVWVFWRQVTTGYDANAHRTA